MPRRKHTRKAHGYDPSKTYTKWIVEQFEKKRWMQTYINEQMEADLLQGR